MADRDRRRNWGGDFQEAEVGHVVAFVAAGAHADEFDFGDNEAVATGVLAHAALQMRESLEVLDSPVRWFVTHPRVPPVVAFDDADEPSARETGARALSIAGVVGEKMRSAVVFVPDCAHVRCEV